VSERPLGTKLKKHKSQPPPPTSFPPGAEICSPLARTGLNAAVGVEEELVCGMLPALSRYDDTSLRSYSGWIVRPSQQPSSRLGCPTSD
jgi:hypothetical protein